MKFPTYEEMGQKVAEKALDEFLYNGKSIREWMQIIASEDAISRQAIKELYYKHGYIDFKKICDLPSVNPQSKWNPCSEDLPTDNGWYQCTVIINDLPRTMELFYKNGKWLDNRRINMFDTYDIYGYGNTTEKHKLSYQELISEFDWTKNVVAWMPLPVPFEPQEM